MTPEQILAETKRLSFSDAISVAASTDWYILCRFWPLWAGIIVVAGIAIYRHATRLERMFIR